MCTIALFRSMHLSANRVIFYAPFNLTWTEHTMQQLENWKRFINRKRYKMVKRSGYIEPRVPKKWIWKCKTGWSYSDVYLWKLWAFWVDQTLAGHQEKSIIRVPIWTCVVLKKFSRLYFYGIFFSVISIHSCV